MEAFQPWLVAMFEKATPVAPDAHGIGTPETTIWPPGVAGRLLPRSREIRPGVYQVGGHGERDPLSLVTV